VTYREGAEVRQGDLLFVIDPRPYRDALASAQAQLERARAAVDLARVQEQRAQTLIGAKAISREEFDTRHADLTEATAAVRAAEAAVATAKLNLGFTEVRAPVSGRAGRAMLTAGNLAQADQTELTTIVPQDPMYVYFDCDEHSYLRYNELKHRAGQSAVAGAVRVALANESGFPHSATLDFLDNHLDPATGTIRARAVLPNPDRIFTAGLYARVRLEMGGETAALVIDDKAVLTDQDRKFVYVIGPQNRAIRKDVVLGRAMDGVQVVESGLREHDRVIVSGLQAVLFPGMPVKPVDVGGNSVAERRAPTETDSAVVTARTMATASTAK
jgi:multidrug efflux system membrane fusion protein